LKNLIFYISVTKPQIELHKMSSLFGQGLDLPLQWMMVIKSNNSPTQYGKTIIWGNANRINNCYKRTK